MEKTERRWESRFLKWFLSLLFISFLFNIGVLVLIHEEPRRGIITFEMLKNHNFLQPTVLGVPYFKKPPLHEWITSLFSVISGQVCEFSLRLPSSIAVVLTSLTIFYGVRRFIGERRALFGALIYPTFYVVLIGYGSKCEPDTLFSLFVTLALFCWFYLFEKGRELPAWLLGYFFTSLALLTKGLPAFQFFYFFVFSYLFLKQKLRKLFSISHLIGAFIGLLPFTAWLLAVKTDQAVETLFSEVLARAPGKVSTSHALKNYLTYPLRFIGATFPWSLIAIYYWLKKRNWSLPEEGILKVFLLAFILDWLLYWVFPGSRLRYLMPALPLLAVLLGHYLADYTFIHKRAKEIVRFTAEVTVPLAIVAGIAVSRNPSLVLKSTLEFIFILYAVYFLFLPRFKINFTYAVVLFSVLMLLLRGFYSSYYYPIAQFKYPPVRKVAAEIVKDSRSYPLFTKTTYLQLCFYVEKGRNAILKFTTSPPPDALFLTRRPEGHLLKEYKIGKHTFYLCSYGITSLKPQGAPEDQKRRSSSGSGHSRER